MADIDGIKEVFFHRLTEISRTVGEVLAENNEPCDIEAGYIGLEIDYILEKSILKNITNIRIVPRQPTDYR